ncbi:hypothetical protein CRENPOLYSF2_3370010 [Crenothrix polyspora]|jgi:hypothetical protein|uniref:Uncharacterized protein n=1 Tax=Crenothrix polyspora TaxID=360316 RepID=A0A1R4HCC5_9GAMM|nr:hypothetical protein [Crenothrix polyspora]SJM93520.1 hypothetical protein CRENPOLYSF2_3370010 [Crenothrix polyspora]
MNEEEQAVVTKYGHLTTEQQEEAIERLKKTHASNLNDFDLKKELDNLIRLNEGYPPFGNRTF